MRDCRPIEFSKECISQVTIVCKYDYRAHLISFFSLFSINVSTESPTATRASLYPSLTLSLARRVARADARASIQVFLLTVSDIATI